MDSDRGHWYLITALVLGVGLGLLLSWVVSPTRLKDTHPRDLRADYKDAYRALIARAYHANQNLPRAKARLDLLDDETPPQALAAQAQRSLAERGDQELAKILANLAAALQRTPQPEHSPTSLPSTSTPGAETTPPEEESAAGTSTPDDSSTPQGTETETTTVATPTITPTPTTAPPFVVQDRPRLCDPSLNQPLIQVYASNAEGEGIPGVEFVISWAPDNQERFITGLKPEIDQGYADFKAQPGVEYTVEIPESGLLLSDIQVPECETDSGDPYPGSYQIYITHQN